MDPLPITFYGVMDNDKFAKGGTELFLWFSPPMPMGKACFAPKTGIISHFIGSIEACKLPLPALKLPTVSLYGQSCHIVRSRYQSLQ
jgi:hypothetical protein